MRVLMRMNMFTTPKETRDMPITKDVPVSGQHSDMAQIGTDNAYTVWHGAAWPGKKKQGSG